MQFVTWCAIHSFEFWIVFEINNPKKNLIFLNLTIANSFQRAFRGHGRTDVLVANKMKSSLIFHEWDCETWIDFGRGGYYSFLPKCLSRSKRPLISRDVQIWGWGNCRKWSLFVIIILNMQSHSELLRNVLIPYGGEVTTKVPYIVSWSLYVIPGKSGIS